MAVRVKRDVFTGELVEETYEPSPRGRTLLYREPPRYTTVQGRAPQRATREDRKRVSKALGVTPAEVDTLNKELDQYGVTDARYNSKTGFLESTNDDHHAAAWAIRGYYDQEATSGVAMRLADRMGF